MSEFETLTAKLLAASTTGQVTEVVREMGSFAAHAGREKGSIATSLISLLTRQIDSALHELEGQPGSQSRKERNDYYTLQSELVLALEKTGKDAEPETTGRIVDALREVLAAPHSNPKARAEAPRILAKLGQDAEPGMKTNITEIILAAWDDKEHAVQDSVKAGLESLGKETIQMALRSMELKQLHLHGTSSSTAMRLSGILAEARRVFGNPGAGAMPAKGMPQAGTLKQAK